MSIPPTYPGVYIQEIPANPHPINPVSTSVAAFLGRAPLGPTGTPVSIDSFAQFRELFGDLASGFPLTYAVSDFFNNGGSQAVIGRLYEPCLVPNAGCATLTLPTNSSDPLVLVTRNPGAWGNLLTAAVDFTGITTPGLFNLQLTYQPANGLAVSERFAGLSCGTTAADPSRVDNILAAQSALCIVQTLAADLPAPDASATGIGGADSGPISAATYIGHPDQQTGLFLFDQDDISFNLLCIPPDLPLSAGPASDLSVSVRQAAADYCVQRRAFYIVDPPATWQTLATAGDIGQVDPADLGISGISATRNAAVYFPALIAPDPLATSALTEFPPCGAVAGIFASTDINLGVWKAPAGLGAGIAGATGVAVSLTDQQDGVLNSVAINCIRTFPGTSGPRIWGARTLAGSDAQQDQFKYINIRRLALFIEQSIYSGTQWVVFEPNDEPLWSALRLSVGSFLHSLYLQGAFMSQPFVKCDATTTTQSDMDNGIVNIVVGFAPLQPAEFIVIQIQLFTAATNC